MNETYGGGVGYALQGQQGQGPTMARMPTLKERLALAVSQAEQRLADTKRAKEIFDKHPDLEELLNLMQRGNF